MKRKNPLTNKTFQEGDKREDGYIFVSYRSIKNNDGYFREDWAHPDIFKRKKLKKKSTEKRQSLLAQELKSLNKLNYRLNPYTNLKFKRGEIEKGKYFWEYRPRSIKKDGTIPEIWYSKKEFEKNLKYFKKIVNTRNLEGLNSKQEGKLLKRKNPLTGKEFISGDIREKDNYIFSNYITRIQSDGFMAENWLSPEKWKKRRIRHTLQLALKRAEIKKIPFNIDLNYLIEIFPKTSLCPILGFKMQWGKDGGKKTSPSLDRIIPEKGYVKGNVMWISDKANTIKGNASLKEHIKVVNWLKKFKR